jgi:bifunctional non-homologous end joining protein LigD
METDLQTYNSKRNFEITAEPQGKPAQNPEKRLRFVVQHHIASRDHYDFRLEWEGVLLSWAVPKGPSYNPRDKRLAVHVENHPYDYRNFEGTIPKGQYGGGTVMLWDEGFWEPGSDVGRGLEKGSLKFSLYGVRLKGKWALVRTEGQEGKDENWLLFKEKDEFAQDEAGISQYTVSVRTGRTMEEIEQGADEKIKNNPFDFVSLQMCKLVSEPPEDGNWLFEVKYDGYRIAAFVEENTARLMTRNGKDFTSHFKEVASSLVSWAAGRAMVLDGEAVITDEKGRTDFQALQNHMKNNDRRKVVYIIFDILAYDGEDIRELPLVRRKEILENIMKNAPQTLSYSKHVKGNGKECLAAARRLNLEGIVGKRAASPYSGTRNGDWIKLKCRKRQEFVIGGYTLSQKRTRGVSSLLLGVYEGKDLIYSGHAGTGFTESGRADLEKKFRDIVSAESPFKNPPKPDKDTKIIWLQPKKVAEVEFAEWTGGKLVRQASFKGLRTDKDPKDVIMEIPQNESTSKKRLQYVKPPENVRPRQLPSEESSAPEAKGSETVRGINITNPAKVIFEEPLIRKIDVVRYYEKVSEHMMPYLANRILAIVRCPKGISEPCFFKKHPNTDNKGIVAKEILNSSGEKEEFFYIESPEGLISEAQMGTLEFHIWGSRVETLEKPDFMVFDLDPDPGVELEQLRRGVRDLKSLLDALSLKSYLKTSGGKGYHIVVPLKPSGDWNAFHDFAKGVAQAMESKYPDLYTSNMKKEKRKGRIFIDWVRNGRGATSIAPYSLRARSGARVSMPIQWEELDSVPPDGVDINGSLERIKGSDPWKDFYSTDQSLK